MVREQACWGSSICQSPPTLWRLTHQVNFRLNAKVSPLLQQAELLTLLHATLDIVTACKIQA